jgi:DNA-directed RNA polymerase II subunit RPB1
MDIYREFSEIFPLQVDQKLNPWVLRIKLDKRKMLERNITMMEVYHSIMAKFNSDKEDISCMYTDDNAGDLVMRIQCIVDINEEVKGCDEEDMICVLKTLERTILNEIILTGIKGIDSSSMYQETNNYVYNFETGKFDHKPKWIIDTQGTNLQDILTHPDVDISKTISNDIWEVYETLGIEAARQVIINEITEVFDHAGSYINSRHIMLLVDTMTNRGSLMSINRHGINKSDRGPLAKCSFEEIPDIIARAAIFGELDKVSGVSSNIMLGQEIPVGTGSIDVLFDEEAYSKNLKTIDEVKETEEKEEESEFVETYCAPENFALV